MNPATFDDNPTTQAGRYDGHAPADPGAQLLPPEVSPPRREQLLEAALAYAAMGWPVLPIHSVRSDGRCSCENPACKSMGKHPRTIRGVKEATTNEATIRDWWDRWPDANVAVATGVESGLVALDVDPRHGGDASLEALVREHGALPETIVSLTGGGGQHFLFRYPEEGVVIRNAAGLHGLPGLDVRGEGGYIVIPPSRHASGGEYSWAPGPELSETALASMPHWLVRLITGEPGPGQPAKAHATCRPLILEGSRNSTLTSLAGSMRRRGMSPESIRAALLEENAKKCKPPLTESEVDAIARSIGRYAPRPGPDDQDIEIIAWPEPPEPEAFHGVAGDFVAAIEPHSEADRVALLLQFLVAAGNVIAHGPHFKAEADKHSLNLFAGLVGVTSKGRKGSSWGHVRLLFEEVDLDWAGGRVQSGLSSGEGLIHAVRDRIMKLENDNGDGDGEMRVVDEGVKDKRLLVLEPEFATTLRVLGREGNTLSGMIRQAWDTGNLRVLTKSNPTQATGAHISIVGHITATELRQHLNRTEIANGFANRFLWVCVKRSKCLPDGGRIQDIDLTHIVRRLTSVIKFAAGVGEVQRDEEARQIWKDVYPGLSEGEPGLLGAVTSRAEAQVMRLACIYALLDLSPTIGKNHLCAALALWRYCQASCRFIFGDTLGDPDADELWRRLQASPEGLTRTAIRDSFGRHNSHRIPLLLSHLLSLGLVHRVSEKSGGRPVERWFAVRAATKATNATEDPEHAV